MQNKSEKIILVTGATGKQGSAAARQLVNHGWHVRILTRDPEKPAAKACAEMGMEVIKGNLDDRDSVMHAAKEVYGIFSVQSLESGSEVEISQGKILADAGKHCKVKHFVYSSVAGANAKTGIAHFESKWQIEQYIGSLALPATILRPVFFMENFLLPMMRNAILEGTLSLPLKPNKALQMIAVDDIGGFAAAAFDNPDEYIGKSIDIAGDELTMPQVAQKLSKVIEREVKFVEMPMLKMKVFNVEWAKMFQWFNDYGFHYDIGKLRQMQPHMMDFETWLHKVGWEHLVKEETAVGSRR